MGDLKLIETDRIYLRKITLDDVEVMYEMDSDPAVNEFLGNNPISNLDEMAKMINFIHKQYKENGVGRLAVIDKVTGNFLGWSGLKYYREELIGYANIYELGYRFLKKYWGKGYATESAIVSLKYGFEILNLNEIYAVADVRHDASNNVLKKIGMQLLNTFEYDGEPHYFYQIKK